MLPGTALAAGMSVRNLFPMRVARFLSIALVLACRPEVAGPPPADVSPPPAVTVDPLATLVIRSGDGQEAGVGTALRDPLAVEVGTALGRPGANATVQFTVTGGQGLLASDTVRTDSTGLAAVRLTLGSDSGSVAVRAAVAGTSLAVSFRARARVFEPDSTAAPEVYNPDWTTASHGKVAPNYAVAFPQSVVNTIEMRMSPAEWETIRTNMRRLTGVDFGRGSPRFPAEDPDYVPVSVRFGGKAWKKVGFRLKGNSSLSESWGQGNYKLPFRLKLNEFGAENPAIKDQRFYGFKELSFSSAWSDPSLMREKIAADLFRAAGVASARTAFYRVFIDFGQGLRYCGVYTAVESIDDTMVKDQFGEDKGNLYKPESDLRSFNEDQFERKNSKTGDFADVRQFLSALHAIDRSTDLAAWRGRLEAAFDVDRFLRWLAASNAMVNWDSYGTGPRNYFLYNHSTGHLSWIPWDHNLALSGSPGVTGPAGTRQGLSLVMNEVNQAWPLVRYVVDDPVYRGRYRELVRRFADSVFVPAKMDAMVDRYEALIGQWVVGPEGEVRGYSNLRAASAFAPALDDLKAHVRRRQAVIAEFLR